MAETMEFDQVGRLTHQLKEARDQAALWRAEWEQISETARVLKIDADKWRALIGSERISVMGSAGLGKPQPNNYAHLTLNFWTKHNPVGTHPSVFEDVERYLEIAQHAQSAPPPNEAKHGS